MRVIKVHMFVMDEHNLEKLSPQERISYNLYSPENGELCASVLV